MTEAVDSSYHARFDTIVDPGQDLELEPMNATDLQASDSASTSIDSFFEAFFSNDALTLQYSYPPPPVADNYRPHLYPDPLVQSMEQINACCAPNNVNPDPIRTQQFIANDNWTIAPSQTVLRRGQEPDIAHSRTRDDYRTQDWVGNGAQPTTRRQRHNQNHARKQPHTTPRAIQPTITDPFPDRSTPYIAGRTTGREDELQGLADAATAVLERPSFQCSDCGKICKTRTGLNHHKVTHDPEKMTRHKCQVCDSGFRYPKDVERHHAAIHNKVQYPCADCHTVFNRKDHLDRHMKSQGHIAASGAISLIPIPRVSPATNTNAYDESSIVGASPSESQPLIRSYGYSARPFSLNQQSLTHLDPSLLQPSPFSSASITTGSIDDTFTVSEDNSFWSQEL